MTCEQAVAVATDWLTRRGHAPGRLRFAGYAWDFRSGYALRGGHCTRGLVTIPTLSVPQGCLLVHGWVVVYDPADRVPEDPEDCFTVWVPEPAGPIRGRQPQSREYDVTVPLTGGRW